MSWIRAHTTYSSSRPSRWRTRRRLQAVLQPAHRKAPVVVLEVPELFEHAIGDVALGDRQLRDDQGPVLARRFLERREVRPGHRGGLDDLGHAGSS